MDHSNGAEQYQRRGEPAQASDQIRLFHHWQPADNCAYAGQHLGDRDSNDQRYGKFHHGCHLVENRELANAVVEKGCREGDADKPVCNVLHSFAPFRCNSIHLSAVVEQSIRRMF